MIKDSRTLIFLIILISFLFLAGIAEANGTRTFREIFEAARDTLITWAVYLSAIAIGVCVVLIASSGGDPKRLADAKRALVYLVIGLAIVEAGKTFTITATTGIKSGAEEIAKDLGAVAMIIGAIFLIYGIFEFAVSGGDPFKLEDAKTVILWSAIGIVIGGLVYGGTLSSISGWKTGVEEISKIFGIVAQILGVGILSISLFKFGTSRGDPKLLEEAKTGIIWGLIAISLGGFMFKVADVLLWFGITI